MIKFLVNIIILFSTFFYPLYYFDKNQADSRIIDSIQVPVMSVLLFGGLILTYLNHRFRKQAENKKWIWTLFEIIGILGVLYGGGILLILYLFRNCCGF